MTAKEVPLVKKRYVILAAVLVLCVAGCAAAPAEPTEPAVLDLSGKYALDTVRNEAIISFVYPKAK